jgi:hypothetical protein
MNRLPLIAAALLFLSGCVSNPGNYYSYEGAGDYYYEDAGADVILDSNSFGYGLGFGWGYGGFGYGFGGYYGGYYGYPWWGYGYSPIWWAPPPVIVVDSPVWRANVQDERARRVALSHRPDSAYPESASWAKRSWPGPVSNSPALVGRSARQPLGRAPVGVMGRPTAVVTQTPAAQPSRSSSSVSSSYSRQSSGARSMRSAPAPRASTRKH